VSWVTSFDATSAEFIYADVTALVSPDPTASSKDMTLRCCLEEREGFRLKNDVNGDSAVSADAWRTWTLEEVLESSCAGCRRVDAVERVFI
jgi:hypothetical protein